VSLQGRSRLKVGVVVPTISGREESLQRTLDAYRATLAGVDYVLTVPRNLPNWPTACNEGAQLLAADACDVLHYGADDLVPRHGWLEAALPVLDAGELPAPRVWNHHWNDGPAHSQVIDGPNGALCHFTRVPILTAAMAQAIGPWPEIAYFADCWLSDAARAYGGWETRVAEGYDFVHHWHQHGRLDGDPAVMERARIHWQEALNELPARRPVLS
jgi:hypothetical protein